MASKLLRYLAAGFAIVAAGAHIPVIAPHLKEAPYMGVLFVLLTVACSALAIAMLASARREIYIASMTVCGAAVVGYAATRLIAFPQLSDDVGNWLEPLGVISIISETVVVALCAGVLSTQRRNIPATVLSR